MYIHSAEAVPSEEYPKAIEVSDMYLKAKGFKRPVSVVVNGHTYRYWRHVGCYPAYIYIRNGPYWILRALLIDFKTNTTCKWYSFWWYMGFYNPLEDAVWFGNMTWTWRSRQNRSVIRRKWGINPVKSAFKVLWAK